MDISTLVLVSSVKDTQLDDSVLEALHSICFDHVQISEDADLVLTVVRLLLDAPAVRTIQNIQRNNELFASALSDFLPVPGEIVH